MMGNDSITSVPSPRKSYPQNWPAYNAAQTSEKDTFMSLLADLCGSISQPEYRLGHPGLPLADMVYVGALKVYSGFSARRFDSDVRAACRQGFTSVTPSFTSVNRYTSKEQLTPVIQGLITHSAEPLSAIEDPFAITSSGFSTSRYEQWFDHKWGKERPVRLCRKAHIAVGTTSNIVAAVEITPGNVHDSQLLPGLVDKTAETFTIEEVSADKAYLSDTNLKHIVSLGAYPFVPFKSNTTGKGSKVWRQLYAYFVMNEESWGAHYHKRSNVETTFSRIKGKFGSDVKSRSETGQDNEILLKVLCHNICVLIQSMHEYGVTPNFEPKVLIEPKGPWLN